MSARADFTARRSALRLRLRTLRGSLSTLPRRWDLSYTPGAAERVHEEIRLAELGLRAMTGKVDLQARFARERFEHRFASLTRHMLERRAARARAERVAGETAAVEAWAAANDIPRIRVALALVMVSLGGATAAQAIAADAARKLALWEAA